MKDKSSITLADAGASCREAFASIRQLNRRLGIPDDYDYEFTATQAHEIFAILRDDFLDLREKLFYYYDDAAFSRTPTYSFIGLPEERERDYHPEQEVHNGRLLDKVCADLNAVQPHREWTHGMRTVDHMRWNVFKEKPKYRHYDIKAVCFWPEAEIKKIEHGRWNTEFNNLHILALPEHHEDLDNIDSWSEESSIRGRLFSLDFDYEKKLTEDGLASWYRDELLAMRTIDRELNIISANMPEVVSLKQQFDKLTKIITPHTKLSRTAINTGINTNTHERQGL